MRYIRKIFESKAKLDLATEFQSVIDLIDEEVGYVDVSSNDVNIEFFENELDIESVEDIDKIESFNINKIEVIKDAKHVCERLELDGYHCIIKYKVAMMIISVLNDKPIVDESIQGWLIPRFVKKTEFGGKEIGEQIDTLVVNLKRLKAWFKKEYGVSVQSVNYGGRNGYGGANSRRLEIRFAGMDEIEHDFCKNVVESLKTFIFKDKNGNSYEPNVAHIHLVPKSKFEGVRFSLFDMYNDRPLTTLNIECNRNFRIDK